ncbi:hypothetical protein C7974DRAFT_437616 [Boeremia exigua]|uniref:uncharacterized protein n=1 Tax=Boeremia exigua TaxID=749465 RepID=UPI001E8EB7AD|nr:uncharacterized protein C7974DRAFT_437616 [Boeremia exigua]KAH6612992.1 hypothetical protein C7974DRAFT_437616 [Boeremia exigua]
MPVFDRATRALIIAYKADGKTNQETTLLTGVEKRFDPAVRPIRLENKHVQDGVRSGRSSKQQEAFEKVVNLSSWPRYLSLYSVESTQKSRLQEGKTNKETWVDETDEEREASLVS